MNDRERWDAKYAGAFGDKRTEPNEYVVEWAASLGERGRALDLAAGTGRHALHLAQTGWETSAWDVSPVGLEILEARALELGVEVKTRAVDASRSRSPSQSSASTSWSACSSSIECSSSSYIDSWRPADTCSSPRRPRTIPAISLRRASDCGAASWSGEYRDSKQ